METGKAPCGTLTKVSNMYRISKATVWNIWTFYWKHQSVSGLGRVTTEPFTGENPMEGPVTMAVAEALNPNKPNLNPVISETENPQGHQPSYQPAHNQGASQQGADFDKQWQFS